MKNNYSTNFYKAYSLWKTTLDSDKKYEGYKKSLYAKTSGASSLKGVVGNKLLDFEWLERIEESLPFMDEAIRESRSFIEQKDEIVSIEKVKRINTQSIRHLAQHTNMIAKVEDNGDVKPDRILNIFYESSFAIYENRFLYTLLGKLHDFVERRYQDLKSRDERIDIKYDINKTIRRKNKVSKMSLEFEYKSQAEDKKIDLKEDVSHLSGFDRVLRIRRILSDFYTLQLIRDLKGCEQIKPPIVKTNLLTKNVNFRTCMDLWDYVSRYRGTGYKYEDKEFAGKMPKKTDNTLADVFIFANFLTEITFNSDLRRNLELSYKKQVKLEDAIAKEKLRLEEEARKEEIQELIRIAVEKATNPLIKKVEALEEKNKKLQFKYDSLQYKHKIILQATNDVVRQHKLIEREQENIRRLEEQIALKNQAIVSARHSISATDYPFTQAKAEEKIREDRLVAIKEQVLKFQEQKQQEIREEILRFQEQKEMEIKNQISSFQREKESELNSLSKRFKTYEEQAKYEKEIKELEQEQDLEVLNEQEALENSEVLNNVVDFPEKTQEIVKEKSEEEKLEDLIKTLEEQDEEIDNISEAKEETEETESLEELLQKLKELS